MKSPQRADTFIGSNLVEELFDDDEVTVLDTFAELGIFGAKSTDFAGRESREDGDGGEEIT